jgi:hypothetical protein
LGIAGLGGRYKLVEKPTASFFRGYERNGDSRFLLNVGNDLQDFTREQSSISEKVPRTKTRIFTTIKTSNLTKT